MFYITPISFYDVEFVQKRLLKRAQMAEAVVSLLMSDLCGSQSPAAEAPPVNGESHLEPPSGGPTVAINASYLQPVDHPTNGAISEESCRQEQMYEEELASLAERAQARPSMNDTMGIFVKICQDAWQRAAPVPDRSSNSSEYKQVFRKILARGTALSFAYSGSENLATEDEREKWFLPVT